MCDYLEYTEKMHRLCDLINRKATGGPKKLAKKLEVSERTVKRFIEQLRDRNFPVIYSRIRESYVCESDIPFPLKIQSLETKN